MPPPPYVGKNFVQEFGKSCPQQALTLPNGLDTRLVKDIGSVVNRMYEGLTPADEDCKRYILFRPLCRAKSSSKA